MRSIGEFFYLFFLYFLVKYREFQEERTVRDLFYKDANFKACDLEFKKLYRFKSPYRISKQFLKEKGERDIYAYGESFLRSLAVIADECGLNNQDKVIELGCGRGRGAFFLASYKGCSVHGIEWIDDFVNKADHLSRCFYPNKVTFSCEDMFQANLKGATAIYLYGTTLDDSVILRLIQKFQGLPKGTKFITVSYPLTDYSKEAFSLHKAFSVNFPWGIGEIYLQTKN